MPVEVEVDKTVTLLLVVLKAVDNALALVEVEVDSAVTPVDSEITPL